MSKKEEEKKRVIFVFGSNEAGKHGAGSARYAVEKYGAIYWRARGLQGDSYAIPTKDAFMRPRSLAGIKRDVDVFLEFAREHEEWEFKVSKVGCGLAGFTNEQIAPFFEGAGENVKLSSEWRKVLEKKEKV